MKASAMAAALAVALLVAAVPARSQNAHGAIAFGETAGGEGVAWGFAWNHATRDAARKAASSACRASGGTGCAELAWFQNGCGALAMDRYGAPSGKGAMTQPQAEARALRSCQAAGGKGCTVVGAQCARPGKKVGQWTGSENVLTDPKKAARTAAAAEAAAREKEAALRRPPPQPLCDGRKINKDICASGISFGVSSSKYQVGKRGAMPRRGCCWKELNNRPRCYVWTHLSHAESIVAGTWSGKCSKGRAAGKGTLSWKSRSTGRPYSAEETGEMVRGKPEGRWVATVQAGNRPTGRMDSEGEYRSGERNGRWTLRLAEGQVTEGIFGHGVREGWWRRSWPDGQCFEELYRGGSYVGGSGGDRDC